jgi:hypothetical protein
MKNGREKFDNHENKHSFLSKDKYMMFTNFKIHATPHISEAYCKCGSELKEVSNGWLSIAMFCPDCERVYTLELYNVPKKKVTETFLKQCRDELKISKSSNTRKR